MKEEDLSVWQELSRFKRKLYLNEFLRNSSVFLLLGFCIIFLFSFTEFSFRLNSNGRFILFVSMVFLLTLTTGYYLLYPLWKYFFSDKLISHEDAAILVGKYFPDINDKVLNYIQLSNNQDHNTLVAASIRQRSHELRPYRFTSVIELGSNSKRLIISISVLLVLLFIGSKPLAFLFIEPTKRIIQYNESFVPPMPFNFDWVNSDEPFFFGENATLSFEISGQAIPQDVYLLLDKRKIKLTRTGNHEFEYTIDRIGEDKLEFSLMASGYSSDVYRKDVYMRPEISFFQMELLYPSYTEKPTDRIANTGNALVPAGTEIFWSLETKNADSLLFMEDSTASPFTNKRTNLYTFDRAFLRNTDYEIQLYNDQSQNNQPFRYTIDVIPDAYPEISTEIAEDSVSYNYILIAGNIRDDYGIKRLALSFYPENNREAIKKINIPINKSKEQRYFYQWYLDSLTFLSGTKFQYYLEVWDNDGVNGSKSSRTSIFSFEKPDKKSLRDSRSKSSNRSEKELSKSLEQANKLERKLKEAQERLKGKKRLSWEDEKLLNEILMQKELLDNQMKELRKQMKDTENKTSQSTENQDLAKKAQQLQELMNEIMDDETKQLYEELEKLLEEKYRDIEDFQELMEKANKEQESITRELDRTIELFKNFKFDLKLDEFVEEAKELAEKQEALSENLSTDSVEEAKEQQDNLQEEYKELEESLESLEELNKDLKKSRDMPDISEEKEEVAEEMENASEQLEQQNPDGAKENMQKSSEGMQQMAQKMSKAGGGGMSMEGQQMEDAQTLKGILDNLVHLSFEQEAILKLHRKSAPTDPLGRTVGERQLALIEDSKIVEDSLTALAERIFQIQSFVMEELDEMNYNLEESMDYLRAKDKRNALVKQQIAMSHMNNLANMLSDVLDNMQSSSSSGSGGKNSKNNPQISELQKQLNQQIRELKKSGKQGREFAEELARLAAEQERIREALKKAGIKEGEGSPNNEPGGNLGENEQDGKGKSLKEEIMEEMFQNEIDLVNKRISENLINRQEDLLQRLLDYEKASKERDKEKEREAKTADQQRNQIPPQIEEYLKKKEKEIELIRTIPAKVNNYYKNEINEYFRRLERK